MLNRREVYSSLGALGAVTVAQAASAQAQAPAAASGSSLDRILSSKKLRMAVVAGQEPYFKKNLTTGKWVGFCIAMGQDIAKQMDVELELVESTWGNSVLDLQANKIDIAFGLNPTPKRALVIDFPPAMFYNVSSLVCRKGFKAESWSDFNKPEVKITYDLGSSRETIVKRYAPKAQHIGYKTSPECILAVASGRADAFAASVFLGLAARKQNTNLGDFVMPTPLVKTITTGALQYDSDGRFRQFITAWTDFNRSSGQVREWILASLGEMGIAESDLPPNLDF
ncbi:MAG TPA: transporter substrate-binding domain-containing protein [Pseudolabrys sp.]|nr:transporter substrate-binding domain-containing protein [Pseudolabrys sp.]